MPWFLGVALCAATTAGCSGASPSSATDAPTGTSVSPVPSSAGTAAPGRTAGPAAVPAATPIGSQTPVRYSRGTGPDQPRNDVGDPWRLDASGARACGFAEFAFRAPETGADPTADLASLHASAASSKNAALVSAVAALPRTPSTSSVEKVLEVCVSLGYEL